MVSKDLIISTQRVPVTKHFQSEKYQDLQQVEDTIKLFENIRPREQSGRDSFGRYRMQIKSAAVASLEILKGGAVDWIYCDYHDDFVVRLKDENGIRYHFFQVKTHGKPNHRWTVNETFGLKQRLKDQSKQKIDQIKESFVGKLLLHTILFEDSCERIVFQTNIHCDDLVEDILNDIHSQKFENKFSKVLIEKFNKCFKDDLWCMLSKERIKNNISKLIFEPDVQYLKSNNNNFETTVGECIYEYSEIELFRAERNEIILKLMDLVERKTSEVIRHIDLKTVEEKAGISIDDLLGVLSISKDAYKILSKGGDKHAVKSASMIQRLLNSGDTESQMIEYASTCKTRWDKWYRLNRHILSELDLNVITEKIRILITNSLDNNNCLIFAKLRSEIIKLKKRLEKLGLLYDLNQDLIVGGVFAELVRGR